MVHLCLRSLKFFETCQTIALLNLMDFEALGNSHKYLIKVNHALTSKGIFYISR